MRELQEQIEKAFHDATREWFAQLLDRKLAQDGVKLSKRNRQLLVDHCLSDSQGTINLRDWKWWEKNRNIALQFSEEDAAGVDKFVEEFIARVPQMIEQQLDELAEVVREHALRNWFSRSNPVRKEARGFRSRLEQRYSAPFEHLRLLITFAGECGMSFLEEVDSPARRDKPHLIEALTRLHARSIRITAEVLSLMEAGYSEGALARWRALHEVATVAQLLSGDPGAEADDELARRYLLHIHVEEWRAAMEYMKHCERLGMEALTEDELSEKKSVFDELVKTFGKAFGTQYGWAAIKVGKQKPTFADLEAAVGLDHLRPHYRLASHNVHANPRGVFAHLGFLGPDDALLIGPSNLGLVEPGRFAAASLAQTTLALLRHSQALDHLVYTKVISHLVDEVGRHFETAEDAVLKSAMK